MCVAPFGVLNLVRLWPSQLRQRRQASGEIDEATIEQQRAWRRRVLADDAAALAEQLADAASEADRRSARGLRLVLVGWGLIALLFVWLVWTSINRSRDLR